MKWGLDAAYPPSQSQALRYRRLGYDWFAGYIGGRALNTWTLEEWRNVSAAGFDILPIWVAPLENHAAHSRGVDDGNAAVAKLQELGMSDLVCLDIENGLTPIEYAQGFIDAAHAGLVDVVIYGLGDTLDAIMGADAWWLCRWITSPMGLHEAPPDWTYWQFSSGASLDFSVAVDSARFAAMRPD
jgi:hypothetical protein